MSKFGWPKKLLKTKIHASSLSPLENILFNDDNDNSFFIYTNSRGDSQRNFIYTYNNMKLNRYLHIIIMQTSVKVISITIPQNEFLPEIIHEFSPEENLLMLKIGSDCLKEGRKAMAGFSQQELSNKIKEESKEQIQRLEIDILVEKESYKKYSEVLTKMSKEQEQQLKEKQKQLEEYIHNLKLQLKTYESENQHIIQKEVEKAKEKFEILLQEKDKQNQLNREAFDKVITMANKSMSKKGAEGEQTFNQLAATFMDFKGYELEDKHSQSGEGDFHMKFDEFDILVDSKNYKNNVPNREREKIKRDLLKNEHLHFAWLISLHSSVDKFDKSPIMYEWVSTDKCICYVNHLLQFEQPEKILRALWFSCKELYKQIDIPEEVDDDELNSMRENQYKTNDAIKGLRKNVREINTTINGLKKMVEGMDDKLKDLLNTESNSYADISLIDQWWEDRLENTNTEATLVSTEIWLKFKQENKDCIKEFDLTAEKFKQIIQTKMGQNRCSERVKNGAYNIKGIAWKTVAPSLEKEPKKKIKDKKIQIKTEPLHKFYLSTQLINFQYILYIYIFTIFSL